MFNITRIVVYSAYLSLRTALCTMRLNTYRRSMNNGLENFRNPKKRNRCTSKKNVHEKPHQYPKDNDDINSLGANKV
jgi:hypothetical protein